MVDFATLVLAADTRQLKTAVTDLKAVADAGAKTEAQTGKTGSAMAGMGGKATVAANANRGLAGASLSAAKGIDVTGVSAARTSLGMQSMTGAAGALVTRLVAVAGAALSLGAVSRAADAWSDMQSVVGAAIKDMEAAPAVMQEISRLARASYSDLGQTARGFSLNAAVMRELGYSAQQMLDYTEAVNHALVINAARGDNAAVVQNALNRALATGKMQATEYEVIMSRSPRVLEAIASEMGVTVSSLRRLSSEGKITGDVIARALTGRLQDLRDEASEMPATMADAFTLIANSFTAFVGVMDKASGASSSVAEILITVADNFNMVVGYAAAAALGITSLYIPAIWGALTASLAWVASLVTLKGALLATGIGAFVVVAGTLIGKFLDLVQSTGSFGAALKAMGELGGLVWRGLIDSAAAIPPGLSGVWGLVKADFLGMLAEIQARWATFLVGLANTVASNPALSALFGDSLAQVAENATQAWEGMAAAAADASASAADKTAEAAGIIKDAFAPLDGAWERLQGTIADGLDTPGASVKPGGSGEESGKKGAKAAKTEAQKQAEAATEALKKLRQEHTDLAATIGMTAEQERIYHAVQELGTGATAAQVAEVKRLIPEIDALKAAKERMAQVAQNGKQALDSLFGSVIDGSKSARDAVLELIGQIARVQAMNAIFQLPGMGGIASGLGDLLTPKVPSFDGGGWTGNGARSGGLDGNGGYLAMVHPREQIIDTTKGGGQSQGGSQTNVHVTVGMDESGNLQVRRIAQQEVGAAEGRIVSRSVAGAGSAMGKTKKFGNR